MKKFKYILRRRENFCAILYELKTALGERIVDPAGQGKDLLPLVKSCIDRDEGSGPLSGFYDYHCVRKGRYDSVS